MKQTAVLALMALGLSACAPTVWVKDGATQQDYNKKSYECEKDSRQSGYFGGGIAGSTNMQSFFNKCMVAHGWTQQEQCECSKPSSRSAPPTSDDSNAARYEIMAAQGIADSQVNLGCCMRKGRACHRTMPTLSMWYNLAAPYLTDDEQKLAVDNRDDVARRMTPAQIAEAQLLASQCQAQQFKGC